MEHPLSVPKNSKKPRPIFTWEPPEEGLIEFSQYELMIIYESFPRQGNSFTGKLLKLSYTQKEVGVTGSTHTEALASVDLPNTEIITITRNPVDCITSWAIKCNLDRNLHKRDYLNDGEKIFLSEEIKKYSSMGKTLLNRKNKSNLTVVPFDLLTSNPLELINHIKNKTQIAPANGSITSDKIIQEFDIRFKHFKTIDPALWSRHGYVPRDKFENYYKILEIVKSSDFKEEMEEANEIHQSLLSMSFKALK